MSYSVLVPDTTVPEWLLHHLLAWQAREGKKKTVTDYAVFLGVSRPTLDKWMNGTRSPGPDSVAQLAERLGDQSLYELVGLSRPDPDLRRIEQAWDDLTPGQREALKEQALKYARGNTSASTQSDT